MKKLDFTSGEKRGLIALFILLIFLSFSTYIYKNCTGQSELSTIVNKHQIQTEENKDSILISNKTYRPKTKQIKNKRKGQISNNNKKRNYRDEYTD